MIPKTKGAGIAKVTVGYDMCFAVTEDHEILVWGGHGVGPTAIPKPDDPFGHEEHRFMEPRPVPRLDGEDVCQVRIFQPPAAYTNHDDDSAIRSK